MQNTDSDNSLVLSFLSLRRLIGILGIALPVIAFLYGVILSPCGGIENSISATYHTHIRNIFVGILCGTGVFMITYVGYDRKDTVASTIAGIFAISIAMFPTSSPSACEHNGMIDKNIGMIHDIVSFGLFAVFAYISIALFTKTNSEGQMTDKKTQRNLVYKICGWTVVLCIVLMLLHMITGFLPTSMHPIFYLEAIGLLAFGISWLTKGEGIAFLNDN